MTHRVAAVIPAAGVGLRLRGSARTSVPKALRLLGERSLLARSLASLSPFVGAIVVAAPADQLGVVRDQVASCPVPVEVVAGGSTRQESVLRALEAVASSVEFVLVHDAARPLAPTQLTERVIEALHGGAAAVVPAVPVADSLRQLSGDGRSRHVDRSALRAVQTPQGFRREVLVEAHRRAADLGATDDATLVERTGVPVTLVAGDHLAFKITNPVDLLLAELLLGAEIDPQR
ncbi:MAG: 2-C-methyl-D-erythritol 4-phosphate cytidylyltransferase [Propionibacteriales bacterium]|nr:2-C-methyl-D-erythritol 4-phosphate cytidylyltransferase [Propionibacteriales bacterium]